MYILQIIIAGLLQGGIIALLSMGVALMFGVLRVVNFAQADFMMLGMYGVIILCGLLQINFAVASALLVIPAFIVGWAIYDIVIKRVRKANPSTSLHAQLLATLGLSMVIQAGAETVWGATPRTLEASRELTAWHIGSLVLDRPRVIAFFIAIALAAAMLVVLRKTYIGRTIRAAASDPEAASFVGINVNRAFAGTFAVSIVISVVAGGILASYYSVTPHTGADFILLMFTALILGGLGNVMGAMVGGLLIGLVQALSQLVLPLELNNAVVFGLFLIMMLIRPSGIFGEVSRL